MLKGIPADAVKQVLRSAPCSFRDQLTRLPQSLTALAAIARIDSLSQCDQRLSAQNMAPARVALRLHFASTFTRQTPRQRPLRMRTSMLQILRPVQACGYSG